MRQYVVAAFVAILGVASPAAAFADDCQATATMAEKNRSGSDHTFAGEVSVAGCASNCGGHVEYVVTLKSGQSVHSVKLSTPYSVHAGQRSTHIVDTKNTISAGYGVGGGDVIDVGVSDVTCSALGPHYYSGRN